MCAAPALFCRYAAWHGNVQLHTLIESLSATVGLLAGAIALTLYHTKKTPAYLLLGSGLIGAALLHGYHAVITSSFFAGVANSAPESLCSWSGVAPRVFLSLLLLLSSAAPEEWARHWFFRRVQEPGVYAAVGCATVGAFIAFTWLPLPPVERPSAFFCRPGEIVPAVLFALTAVQHLRRGAWKTEAFAHWFILSLIAAAAGHSCYLLFSSRLYDARHVAAHLLMLLSFVLLMAGLLSSVLAVFRSEKEAVDCVRRTNDRLADQIERRVPADSELQRSRDELEARVRDRTMAAAERSRELANAHAELELVLTSIPSILIGLDEQGRITRWNPRAAETFGVSSSEAAGRPFDDCGIAWCGLEMRAEVSRWLRSRSIYRTDDIAYERDGKPRLAGLTVVPILSERQETSGLLITGADITERRSAEAALAYHAAIVEAVDASIIGVDLDGRILTWNAGAERMLGYSLEEAKGRHVAMLWPPELRQTLEDVRCTIGRGEVIEHVESVRMRKDGNLVPVLISYSPVRDGSGKVVSTCSIGVDITERKRLEQQLAQAQKLESIGQLAAGIAHEINTPIQYVGDNIRFLRDSFARLEQLFEGYDRLVASVRETIPEAGFLADVERLANATRVRYLRAEIPKSIEDSLDGAGRVADIVRAMKEFSHPGSEEKRLLDVNRAIESTVRVSRNEWKYVADLKLDLDPDLPAVPCLPGELNQVILNLIVNAAHAIADVAAEKPGAKGVITVSTCRDGEWVEIRVRDTGTGIPEDVQSSIFNPFFTTKGVGKGTGQGLAIAHAVVVQKHGGTISFETATGAGTTFKIRLPAGGLAAPEDGSEAVMSLVLPDTEPGK